MAPTNVETTARCRAHTDHNALTGFGSGNQRPRFDFGDTHMHYPAF